MKITMFTIGSTGDVLPYVLLGMELQHRGHQVTLACFSGFEELIERSGLKGYTLTGDVVKLMSSIMGPGVNGLNYLKKVDEALGSVAPLLLNDLLKATEDADAIVCNFFGSMYYSVAEKRGIPCIQSEFFPMDLCDEAPISSAPGQNLGRGWNRLTYRLGYLLISLLEKRYLTAWRKENGMRVRRVKPGPDYRLGENTIPVIYAISPHVWPRPKAWGEDIHMSGFWWGEQQMDFDPPEEMTAFLDHGEKPVYIGFGSMVSGDMENTFDIVMRAVKAAGVRAVIGLGWGGDRFSFPSDDQVCFISYAPHDWLLPRMKAIVHHGGAGTTAAGLRYGLPTLVVPFGGDQPFWGHRVHRIGCGPRPISRKRMTVERLAGALKELTSCDMYRQNAMALSEKLRAEKGIQVAADVIENTISNWKADKKAE